MQHFYLAIYSFSKRRKSLALALLIGILLLFVFFASKLQFSEDITRLIPINDKSNISAKVLNQMNFVDKISIIITSENNSSSEDLSEYANQFLDSLDANSNPYVAKVQGKIDEKNIQETFAFVYAHLPLFLDKSDYQIIQNKLQNDSIAKSIEGDYKSLISPAGMISKEFILQDPLGISSLALKKLQQLSVGDDFELQNGYVITKDKKNLLLFITPKLPANETDKNTLFIEKLQSIKTSLNAKFKGKVNMRYFGATPVAVANATQIKVDVKNTSVIAALSLIVILVFFYRSISTPIIIFIPSLFGAAFALAVLFFTKGTISAISLGISSILLGETTDYSIYVLTHLRNNKDVKLLYKDISKPLILCGTTTAITFLCLFFVKSEALQDLGIFAALSVIATSMFSLVLMPLLYKTKPKFFALKENVIDTLGTYSYHRNKFLVVAVFVVLMACFFTYSKVTFNNDLSALNYVPSELKTAEKELESIANGSSKSIYLATYGNHLETVLENNNLLFDALAKDKKAAQIVNYSSIGGIIFSKQVQVEKIKEWNSFWNTSQKAELKSKIIANGKSYGFIEATFTPFYELLDTDFQTISLQDYTKVKSFFLEEFVTQKNGFYTIATLVKVPIENRNAFIETLKKQKNTVVIDRLQMNESFLGELKNNFENLVDYSFITVFLILLFAFRRIELAIISSIPILISWIFTTGIMGMFDIQFNIINIIVCTLIFGIGVDYSIFMTFALQKEHTYGKVELPTYRTSILLSVSTTILGIGVLVFAKHPALKSISIIAIIGIFSALLITFIIQPLVFHFFVTSRVNKGKAPFQLRSFLHGILSFCYYGLGGILVSLFSLTIMRILPLKLTTKMKGFRYAISKFMKSVLYTNPFVTKKVNNKYQETFEKPAVIIANHTSFLDILAVGMLSPKTIYLVSDWVYNSPIFGAAVKKAGFYPVSEGLEGGVDHLQKKIAEGYSLIVFPEGTRSQSNQIQRFHKGAFYLAERFNLDIIPVVIHGNSEVLPKGDFIIYDGSITVTILERISASDSSFGENYTEKTKNISTFFKSEFHKIRAEIEGPSYFKNTIINSFDYKETSIIRAVKNDFNLNLERYYQLNKYLAANAKVLHLSDDYGQLDVLLSLQAPLRKIVSLISNDEKRAVAKTNYWLKKRAISYLDSNEFEMECRYDVILISYKNASVSAWASKTNCIILVGEAPLKNTMLDLGFSIVAEENQILVFKKE